MDQQDAEFIKRLRGMFKLEAEEHLARLSSNLLELEKLPVGAESGKLIESIFREAHSLKGAARSVNRTDIETLCQNLESVFSMMKSDHIELTPEQFDLIHKGIDSIVHLLQFTEVQTKRENLEVEQQIKDLIKACAKKLSEERKSSQIQEETKPKIVDPPPFEQTESKSSGLETIRIEMAKLDHLYLEAEQMIQTKVAASQRILDSEELIDQIRQYTNFAENHSIYTLPNLPPEVREFLFETKERLLEVVQHVGLLKLNLENDQRSLSRIVDDHLDSMKDVLLLPFSSIISGFPKMIRDLSRSQRKEVDYVVSGEDVQVDKRILEELKDPLIHLLRNCVDHGIEQPSERIMKDKPARGLIELSIHSLGSREIEIHISDDGSGINSQAVLAASIKAGLIAKKDQDNYSPKELADFIFESGVSTSPFITSLSGRGLGLAIVKDKVEKLGGVISLDSQQGKGSSFHLILPLTRSTFRGVLIHAGPQKFIVPTSGVERVIRTGTGSIKTVENKPTLSIGGELIPVLRLADVLGIRGSNSNRASDLPEDAQKTDQFLILRHGNRKVCYQVDSILEELQVVVKDLGTQLESIRFISGASVLGSGEVVPVLKTMDLIHIDSQTVPVSPQADSIDEDKKTYKLLVTEDSITSRTLIRDILETAGYEVETAVDGMDGYTKALIGGFDLIVSDVDMPRLNGFEMTAKIRKEPRLSEIPIVLITALESREDREHGIEVGANAYIVKSSFDQSNLLGVIEKLV